MKLGYIYTVTSEGYDDDKVRINTGAWSDVVEDERQLWIKHSSNGESIAMTFIKEGVVLAVTRITGSKRPNDNITTWIFVPSKIYIKGSQIKQVIEEVKNINRCATKKVTPNLFTGNEILNADYEEKKYPILYNSSVGTELAGRYPTTDYSLAEILDRPYQKYYTKFKYIFLLNHKSDIKEGLVDLSNEDIIESICVLPPSNTTIQRIFGSLVVTIKFKDGQQFISPIMVPKNQIIDLEAEKDDCLPISLKGQAIKDEAEIEIFANDQQWKRRISSNLFKIEDSKTGRDISSEARVDILEPTYDSNERSLPEDRMQYVKVKITANGYEQFEGNIDLSQGTKVIKLNKSIEKETYNTIDRSGYDITVTISGPGAKSQYPLKGYRSDGHNLIYMGNSNTFPEPDKIPNRPNPHKHSFAWREFCYGMLAAFLLSLICYYIYITVNRKPTTSCVFPTSQTITPDTVPVPANIAQSYSLSEAILYMDKEQDLKKAIWHKDSLDKFSDLKGLWDDLNNMETEKLSTQWKELLSKSTNFQKVAESAKKNLENRWNPKQGPHSPTYNTPTDYRINLANYIYWLDQDQTPRPTNPPNSGSRRIEKKNKPIDSKVS
ncbi:MAG: hypothetical protein HDR88_03535 [Bacteroides sp.]|nr:hypothetical protein [Bacteroides sp.]